MISSRLRQQRFYGWTVLAGAMLVIFSMVGNIIVSYGVFLPTMCDELDWSRSVMSTPYTVFWIVMGLLGPLVGISTVKFGPRRNIIFGNIVIVLGVLGMSLVKEIWHVYLFFSVLIGVGQAFGSFIATNTVATNWFVRRRSLVISLLAASGGVGGLAFPPLMSWLISSQGWQMAWVYVAGIHFILAVVIAGILIRDRPEEIGQIPDGDTADLTKEGKAASPVLNQVYQTPVEWGVGDVLRTPAFWLMVAFSSATMFTLNFLSLHQVAYLLDIGYSHMVAATTIGLLSGMSIIGQLTSGALGVKFEGRYLAAFCLAGLAVGITILMNVRILPLIYLHTIVSGISCGGIMVIMPVLIGAYFGRAKYAQILGWTTPITTIFSAGSPVLAGYIFDSYGSYTYIFVIALVFLGVGLVCALLAQPPKPRATMLASVPQ